MELKDDTVIVVLGASGDLAKKKTVCASNKADPRTGGTDANNGIVPSTVWPGQYTTSVVEVPPKNSY